MGGAERALYNVLSGGLAERFDSAVLSLGDEGTIGPRIRDLGVPVYTLNVSSGLPSPKALARLRKIVRSINPDVLQGWMYHGNLAASITGKFSSGRPAVVWNVRHSLYDLAVEKLLTRQVIRANRWLSYGAGAIIYNSRVSNDQHEAFGFDGTRSRVIPNGFDLETLKPDMMAGASVREEFGIPKDATVIGHVARFHPMKDHAGFLRAAVTVAQKRLNVHFLLIGRGVSLDNPALVGIVPSDLASRFICLGERSDVYDLMQAMDVLCLSSAWGEAFPNVLGEAMASGVPCVATDVGDSADIIADTGRIVPTGQPHMLAAALLDMLDMPVTERLALGRAARKRIEAKYALPVIVSQYAELYEQLIQGKL